MIRINDVTKKFPTVTALQNISLTVADGEFFGLLGPNGAGKSTLMNLLIGYLDPDGGEITVGDDKVTRDNLEARKTIVYTTHYMEEAERLCTRIAIIDSGTIITEGTLDDLLAKLSYEESISIIKNSSTIGKLELFRQFGTVIDDDDRFELKPNGTFRLSSFFKSVEEQGVSTRFIEMSKPTLEALFLNLTGRSLRD